MAPRVSVKSKERWVDKFCLFWKRFMVIFVPIDLLFIVPGAIISAATADSIRYHPAFKTTCIVLGSLSTFLCLIDIIQDVAHSLCNDKFTDAVRKRGRMGMFFTLLGCSCFITSTVLFVMGATGWDWGNRELAMVFVGLTVGIADHFATLSGMVVTEKAQKEKVGVVVHYRLDDLPHGGKGGIFTVASLYL